MSLGKFGTIVHRASIPAYNNSPSLHVAACSYARWSAQRLLDISISASLDGVLLVGERGHLVKQTILRAGTASRFESICLSRCVLTAVKKVLAVQVVSGTFKFGRGYLGLSACYFAPSLAVFYHHTLKFHLTTRPSRLAQRGPIRNVLDNSLHISGGTTLAEL